MIFEWAHRALDIFIHASVGTARASIVALMLLLIGFPLSRVFATRTGVQVTAGLGMLSGMLLVSTTSWYAYRFGISIKLPFSILIAVGLVWLAAVGRKSGSMTISHCLPTAVAFIAPVFAYSVMSYANIPAAMLPILTTGNGDLLAYLKLGDVLLNLPSAATFVDPIDIRDLITSDVYGSFNLIALASFILRVGVEKCAIPVMGVGVGLVSLGIASICRRAFNLPTWLSVLVALLMTTSVLFSYTVLCYFLAQILFMGILLASLGYIADATQKSGRNFNAAVWVILISSATIMFFYHPWFLQYAALASFALGMTVIVKRPFAVKSVATGAAASLAILIATNLFDLIVGTSRYLIAVQKTIFVTTVAAGWPKPFVNLALLIGAPTSWTTPSSYFWAAVQILPVFLIVCGCMIAALKFDRSDNRNARLFMLGCFSFSTVLYLVAWEIFGAETYRQWKFATTLPLSMGFTVMSYVLFLILQYRSKGFRAMLGGALAVIALLLVTNVTLYFTDLSENVFHFRQEIRDIAQANEMPNVQAVYIDLPETIERMAAAIYVNKKPIIFSRSTTNYGASSKKKLAQYTSIAAIMQGCAGRHSIYIISEMAAKGADRILPVAEQIDLTGTETECLYLSGFSGSEPWGRWTDGRSASIRAICDCDLTKSKISVVLKAGTYLVPGKIDHQRVIFRVNGSAPQTFDLTSMDKIDIALDAPADPSNPSNLDIEMELPDAVSPSQAGSGDTRLLGLGISSFSIVPKS